METKTRLEPPVIDLGRREQHPRRRPMMLAIAGDSAAGKTTLAAGIRAILGRDRITAVCTDDYHRYDRAQRAANGITPLHPACNYIDVIEQHLELLRRGEPILKPVYQHATGTFGPPLYVRPNEIVVVEGLLPLFTERMRSVFDATVYLDPPEDLRRRWKIQRDCAKRGYEPEQVLDELERREKDSATFIRPQRNRADIVVRFSPPRRVADGDDAHLDVSLVLRPRTSHPDLSSVLGWVESEPIRLRLGRDAGAPVDVLEIDGCVEDADAARVEDVLWDRMHGPDRVRREEVGRFAANGSARHSHALALTQLLIVSSLLTAGDRA